jgi:hypothetical protein
MDGKMDGKDGKWVENRMENGWKMLSLSKINKNKQNRK